MCECVPRDDDDGKEGDKAGRVLHKPGKILNPADINMHESQAAYVCLSERQVSGQVDGPAKQM